MTWPGSSCLVVATALLFASATPAASPRGGADGGAAAAPRTSAGCEDAGGTWRRMGLRGIERCDLPAPDAGRACKSSRECASACVTDPDVPAGTPVTGRCYEQLESVGRCYNPVHRGVARGVLCKD